MRAPTGNESGQRHRSPSLSAPAGRAQPLFGITRLHLDQIRGELNEALAVILAGAEILQRPGYDPERRLVYIQAVQEAADQARQLLSHLESLSR